MVLTASTKSGEIYEGYGPSGSSIEGIRKDLEGIWHPVWYHDMDADIAHALTSLKENGAFA